MDGEAKLVQILAHMLDNPNMFHAAHQAEFGTPGPEVEDIVMSSEDCGLFVTIDDLKFLVSVEMKRD